LLYGPALLLRSADTERREQQQLLDWRELGGQWRGLLDVFARPRLLDVCRRPVRMR
jgi:hypothetical protein